jgi:hypothetical protein
MKAYKKLIVTAATLITLANGALAQSIQIKSNGDDLRRVIASVFEQAKQQYVLETNLHQTLYMSLDSITFEKAVEILSNVADLKFEKKQGIWYINRRAKQFVPKFDNQKTASTKGTNSKGTDIKGTVKGAETKANKTKQTTAAQEFANTDTKKPVSATELNQKLSTRLSKTDIRDVFDEFSKQTKVEIVVDSSVPHYKIDAFMFNTSLKFALERVCKAAGLKYIITGKIVQVSKA